jgi:outer membrane protein OmpA-like peptidoglycan-associated protein
MNKSTFLLLFAIIALPGCGGKKKQKAEMPKSTPVAQAEAIDIPVADDNILSFFDDNIGEFAVIEDEVTQKVADEVVPQAHFKEVYFDYDRHEIRPDQELVVEEDIAQIKQKVSEAKAKGEDVTVVTRGHACRHTKSQIYNLAKSEQRAVAVAERLKAEGVNEVKVVGCGCEEPAIINGNPVIGSREEEWPNRRVEVKCLPS